MDTTYQGNWKGALFFKPQERKIYQKGAIISEEISATVDGYLTESVPESGIYDQYQATWKVGRLGTTTTSATITLNGSVSYQSESEFPATELYVLQTNMEGTIPVTYNIPLDIILTHLRVTSQDNPYSGEGFSIISYTTETTSGQGWTYDTLNTSGKVKLKGLVSSPLFGIINATLNESKLPRTMSLTIQRVDLGLPPAADLKVKIWGLGRVSPGQTVNYIIEYRNDGLKAAEDITLVYLPPFPVNFIWASPTGSYDDVIHVVRWDFDNIPPKTGSYLNVQERILWGLPEGDQLPGEIHLFSKGEADSILQHASPLTTEEIKMYLHAIWVGVTHGRFNPSPPIPYDPEFAKNWPVIRARIFLNEATTTGKNIAYAQEIHDLASAIHGGHSLTEQGWTTSYGRNFPPPTSWGEIVFELQQHYNYTSIDDPDKKIIPKIATPHDPNIKYGPEGNVSAGQKLDYRIEYEGEGIAFGVYFTDILDEDLDDSTLTINPVISTSNGSVIAPAGTYNPATRTITWLVGEVDPSEGGYADISVNVRGDAPDGTEIINYATVYFPSVPEETRTNGIVSVVGLNQPPVAQCQDVEVPADNNTCQATASIDSGSSDPDGDTLSYSQEPPSPYSLGNTSVTLTVTDTDGLSDSCTRTVTVIDTTPPEIGTSASIDSLWPPNHKMSDVGFSFTVSDSCDPGADVSIEVTSDEPTATAPGAGGSEHAPDAEITGNNGVRLRAERSSEDDGRVYVITATATDASGKSNSSSISVNVNHDKKTEAIDSGQNYNATQIN